MTRLLIGAAVLLLAWNPSQVAAAGKTTAPVDPQADVAKSFGGKVWLGKQLPIPGGRDLHDYLSAHSPGGEADRPSKDATWTVQVLAVFKKAAAKGPMTIRVLEKHDLVDVYTATIDASSSVFRGDIELEPDKGFNAGHRYTVQVGQILKGKFQPYASGELALK